MLKSITFKNFKSYEKATLFLSPLTVLIGANASGKSNAIEGLRLLSWMAHGQKLSALQYVMSNGEHIIRGRPSNLFYRGASAFEFGCETDSKEWNQLSLSVVSRNDGLHIQSETISMSGASVPLYSLSTPSSGISTDVSVAYNNFARGGHKPHIICNDQMPIFTQLSTPAVFGPDSYPSKVIPPVVGIFEQMLSSILFLDPVPARMRDYSFLAERELQSDGANISAVLANLCGGMLPKHMREERNRYLQAKQDILSFVQSLPEQDIADIDFYREPRGGRMVVLIETFGGRKERYDASLLSDGTLRVLSIGAAMLSAREGSLVVIEEIDNGVHPSRAKHLLSRIQAVAQKRNLKVILSTHNPALLDALPSEAIPDVVFCYRDPKSGSSKLVRLEEIVDYPELLAQGTLGYLSVNGIIDRYAKNPQTDEDKKTRALAWLERMKKGGEA
jgi:predicted ATPase